MAFLLAFLFLYIWNYLVYTSLLILVQIKFLIHFLFSQVIYQLRLPGDCKSFTFKCSVNVTIKAIKKKEKSAWNITGETEIQLVQQEVKKQAAKRHYKKIPLKMLQEIGNYATIHETRAAIDRF